MKRFTYLMLNLSFIILFNSCAKDDVDDEIRIGRGFVESISVSTYDNGGNYPSTNKNRKYHRAAFLMAINVRVDSSPINNPGRYVVDLNDPITAIKIYTVGKYSNSFPAGSDISELFKQYPLYINNNLYDTLYEGKAIIRMDHVNGFFYKALLDAPDPGKYQFKIEIEFERGEKLTTQTEEFELI